MRGLDKRLRELETATPFSQWGPVLDRLSLEELDQLEGILRREEAGMPFEEMSGEDQALLDRWSELERAARCG